MPRVTPKRALIIFVVFFLSLLCLARIQQENDLIKERQSTTDVAVFVHSPIDKIAVTASDTTMTENGIREEITRTDSYNNLIQISKTVQQHWGETDQQPERDTIPNTLSVKTRSFQLLFYHFHKSGGHALCSIAKKNNERTPKNEFCANNTWDYNVIKEYPLERQLIHAPCDVQTRNLLSQGDTFSAVEFLFNWIDLCPFPSSIRTMTVIRHPVSRLASQYNHDFKYRWLSPVLRKKSPKNIFTNFPTDFIIDNYDYNVIKEYPLERQLIHAPCDVQTRNLLSQGDTFSAVEFLFNWIDLCPFPSSIRTMTVIRHPVSRLASQYNHDFKYRWLSPVLRKKSPKNIFTNFPTDFIIDNYQTRRILGKTGYGDLKKQSITEEDATHAISLLQEIDFVIPLERLCEAAPLLQRKLGWNPNTIVEKPSQFSGKSRGKILTFDQSSWPEIIYGNKADYRLWEAANKRLTDALKELPVEERQECDQVEYAYIPWDRVQSKPAMQQKRKGKGKSS